MSKTTQENKKKALKEQAKVEETSQTKKSRNATVGANQDSPIATETAAEIISDSVTQGETAEASEETVKSTRAAKVRGKRYKAAKAKIDVTKYYPLREAIDLVKETSLSKFEGKIEAHVTSLDIGTVGEITFPHLETATKKIVVLNDIVLAEIKEGKINFDILIATPTTMPRLLPFAKTLGPKGLMPNPKSGTLTDKPEEAVKKLSVAKTVIKTEKKAPVIHIVVGKVSQPINELMSNIDELIKVVKPSKIKKLAIWATMGPSVKVEIK
jgi:large subunit ribosomal protein L1